MRLGLLGGTFDPVHRGHVRAALEALRHGVDVVAFVPARHPPHKSPEGISDPFHRFAMAALAAAGHERLTVSAIEVARPGPSYTIDTVRRCLGEGHDLTLIMGGDSLAEIDTWREGEEILRLTRVLVYRRRPFEPGSIESLLPSWARSRIGPPPGAAGSIVWLDIAPDDISSTEIRARARRAEAIAGMVPDQVAEYLRKHQLYRGGAEGATD